MLSQPLPDLSASLRLQDQSRSVRAQLDDAALEVTTGISADVAAATKGDLAPVFGIDRELSELALREQDLSLAQSRASVAQAALEVVEGSAGTLGLNLQAAIGRGDPVVTDGFLGEAEGVLESVVAGLNTQFAGRSLFSGAAEDTVSLSGAEEIIADVRILVAGAADATAAIASLDTYFGPGGGFETTIYQGATVDTAGAELDTGTRIDYLPRADADAFREIMRGAAMITAVDSAGFVGNDAQVSAFLTDASASLQTGSEDVVAIRAELGTAEEEIANARDAAQVEQSTLQIARTNLIGVDQYDAATRLSELENQLETLYVVTSRLSNLSLTNYLR